MPFYTTQVTIPTADNNIANFATNTFHFDADDLTALGLVHGELENFYEGMTTHLSSLARQNGWTIKSYDLSDPVPRAPVLETTFDLSAAPSSTGLPPEVTLCLSFQGDRVSGVPQSRRRGRIYFPFLDASLNGGDGRPTSTIVNALLFAGESLLTASDAAGTWSWQVWSTVDQTLVFITNGWVDNEWDTQRRRGRVATSRSVFP